MASKRAKNTTQAPKWFQTFVTDQFVPLQEKVMKQGKALDLILERLDRIENILTRNKIDGILERNHLV